MTARFTQRFSATPRGARLARRLALQQSHDWGIAYGTEASDSIALIVAELAANAVTHGRVPGRDFELRLSVVTGTVRIEVTDTDNAPCAMRDPRPLDEAGRGLVLVDALAARWEVVDREPPPGKTVRAEVDVVEVDVAGRRPLSGRQLCSTPRVSVPVYPEDVELPSAVSVSRPLAAPPSS